MIDDLLFKKVAKVRTAKRLTGCLGGGYRMELDISIRVGHIHCLFEFRLPDIIWLGYVFPTPEGG